MGVLNRGEDPTGVCYMYTQGKELKITKRDQTVSVLPDDCPVPDCVPGAPSNKGHPASPGTRPFPVFFSVQGQVLQEEEDLPPRAVSVLLVLLYMKPMKLVCNALKLSGDLYLCPMLPLSFRGLLPKGQACRETGRERKPVAGIAVKESLGFLCHPTRQHNTLAWGSWAEGLGGLVFLAYGPEPRTTAVSEREELEPAEGAIQLALGEQVSREQAPRLCPWLPILWLEHIIFQLLHTLRWLHLSWVTPGQSLCLRVVMPGLCARVQGDEHSGGLAPTLDREGGGKLQRAAAGGGGTS